MIPRNIVIDSTAIVIIVAAAFFASGGLERRDAVGNGLDACHRGAAVRERAQQQEQPSARDPRTDIGATGVDWG